MGAPDSPYRPPRHMQPYPMPATIASSEWEWNNLASRSGVELWAIRVPRDLKVSKLAGLQFATPGGSSDHVATLSTSRQNYTLHDASAHHGSVRDTVQNPSLRPTLTDDKLLEVDPAAVGKGKRTRTGEASTAETREAIQDELGDARSGGGEEMHALKVMLPDAKRGGKYYVAPKSISRHLVLKASYEKMAAANEDAAASPAETTSTTARRPQPLDKLKYRNIPFGAANEEVLASPQLAQEDKARLVTGTAPQSAPAPTPPVVAEDVVMADADEHKQKKKRKSEGASKAERSERKKKA